MAGRAADDALEAEALVEHLAQVRDLVLELPVLEQVHHPLAQLVEVDRLGQVVIGADLHGLDRGFDRAVASDQDDAEIELVLAHFAARKPSPSMPGMRRSVTASRTPGFSCRYLSASRASSNVRTPRPAFSMAMAIDSREPVSSSMTMTGGVSVMAPFWHR